MSRLFISTLPGVICLFLVSPAGARPDPDDFVFVQKESRPVAVFRRGLLVYGRLDEAGLFFPDDSVPEPKMRFDRVTRRPTGEPFLTGAATGAVTINLPRGGVDQPAFEYRSGALIPGTLRTDGVFAPQPGGVVTAFKEYRYTPDAPLIWNLPGTFVKKSDLPKPPPDAPPRR